MGKNANRHDLPAGMKSNINKALDIGNGEITFGRTRRFRNTEEIKAWYEAASDELRLSFCAFIFRILERAGRGEEFEAGRRFDEYKNLQPRAMKEETRQRVLRILEKNPSGITLRGINYENLEALERDWPEIPHHERKQIGLELKKLEESQT